MLSWWITFKCLNSHYLLVVDVENISMLQQCLEAFLFKKTYSDVLCVWEWEWLKYVAVYWDEPIVPKHFFGKMKVREILLKKEK